jgi:hypothetical protein
MNKLNRRRFVAASTAAGLLPLTKFSLPAAQTTTAGREYYELRQYQIDTAEQKAGFDSFMREAAIPALNRLGSRPVGVFYPKEGLSPIYFLLRHRSLESMDTLTQRIFSDAEFLNKGAAFLDSPPDKPAYQRSESSLLRAFSGMPELELPVKSPNRVLQLRIYESPTVKAGQKKIEMFNDAGEIKIFREVGLHPVFFGQTLIGSRMPNLIYLLAFESEEELSANWRKFGAHPLWQKLKGMPEYADKKLVSKITNLILKPAEYSQI